MHGNTKTISNYKVRNVSDIINEIKQAANFLQLNGFILSGLHLEATYEDITECLGGIEDEVTEDLIPKNYSTYCDPRLNFKQVCLLINEKIVYRTFTSCFKIYKRNTTRK